MLLVVPALLTIGALDDATTATVGEPAPRTILADDVITVVDEEATTLAQDRAREGVDPIIVPLEAARSAIVDDVRGLFSAVVAAREPVGPTAAPSAAPGADGAAEAEPPPAEEQVAILEAQYPELPMATLDALVALDDEELLRVRQETVGIAQFFVREDVVEENVDATLDDLLAVELPLRDLPEGAGTEIVTPVLEAMVQPTMVVDAEATATARDEAEAEVEPVSETFGPGDPIVTEGRIVTPLAAQALQESGLEGSSAWARFLRSLGAMALVLVVTGVYLWRMQPRVWNSSRKIVLLASIIAGYAALVTGVSLFAEPGQVAWWYLVPVGALAMLVSLLIHPVVAIASMLPAVALVTLSAPLSNGVAVFTAGAVLLSVPLSIGLQSRSDLRSATFRAGLAMPVLAAISILVFGPRAEFWEAVGAAALNGLLIALLVQGVLPFLETLFRLPTVTALLDLADRNHPLLRELETKAIGSYNHSVMVASLTERACREIGADPLLGSVAALYHDIGKIRRPHFFIENQYGIPNPHDELEPEVSAVIIMDHVIDGVRMATEYKLPPEVVAAIGSHHGTMVVSYFYNKAVEAAGHADDVDEDTFRYKGSKPRSKEAAVLVIADCSEAATRSMAMKEGTLSRAAIEETVDGLVRARVDDGQFDQSALTFDELRQVQESVVAALEGIYHPRIAYPGGSRPDDAGGRSARPALDGASSGRADAAGPSPRQAEATPDEPATGEPAPDVVAPGR
nr:HDIG domain-containing metalloprotein [Salsipaludibacter albus]